VVELERERVELLQRTVVVGVRPRATQSGLDRFAVPLGEVVHYVA
jgi:hypothetical protein